MPCSTSSPPRWSSTATSSSEASDTWSARGVGEPDVAQAHADRPVGQARASGRSVIIGGRSSTSKTRSNDTSAVITSTRALASAVIGV